jgi:hypothetical protein
MRYLAEILSIDYNNLLLKVYLGFNVIVLVRTRLYGIEIFANRIQELPQFVMDWAAERTILVEVKSDQDIYGLWLVDLMHKEAEICEDPPSTTHLPSLKNAIFSNTLAKELVNHGLAKKLK